MLIAAPDNYYVMIKGFILGISLMLCFEAVSAQNKTFSWTPWAKVSADTKARLKKIKGLGDETAFEEITSQLQFGGTASLAIVDLDGDGIAGYAIGYGGSVNCGSAGCSFTVYEQSGRKRIDVTDTWQKIKPAKGGITTSTGKYMALRPIE